MSIPDFISSSELSDRMAALRNTMVVNERIDALVDQLHEDFEDYLIKPGRDCPMNPVHRLKLEAMAIIGALASFHCSTCSHLNGINHSEDAHHWAKDEGVLYACMRLLQSVDTDSITKPGD